MKSHENETAASMTTLHMIFFVIQYGTSSGRKRLRDDKDFLKKAGASATILFRQLQLHEGTT